MVLLSGKKRREEDILDSVYESHRINTTLGARHDQARVQSVALYIFVSLSCLIHVRSHALDLTVAHSDGGFDANSIALNGLGG